MAKPLDLGPPGPSSLGADSVAPGHTFNSMKGGVYDLNQRPKPPLNHSKSSILATIGVR
jgi:hypothetical protein